MFKLSTDTTINQGALDSKVIHILEEHLIRVRNGGDSQFIDIQKDVSDDWVVLGLAEGPYISPKPFFNPVKFDLDDITYFVIDVRTSTRFDRMSNRPVISNQPLFRRDMIRVLLESVWVGNGPNDILNLGHYQIQVFATWIAEMFAKRFALDAEQQVRISVLAAFYYLCLFVDAERADLRRFIPVIGKVTQTGVPFVMDTLSNVEFIGDVQQFLDTVKTTLETDRLEGVEIDILITMLAGSWFGANNSVLVGIALEYPPVWNALLYLSLTDRTHRASGIAKIALRRERDQIAREYVSIVSRLLMQESTLDPTSLRGGK